MIALRETQMRILDALRRRSDGIGSRSGSGGGSGSEGRPEGLEATRLLRAGGGASALSAARRLQIYRNNLFESLGSALEAVYPVVAQLVGEDYFRLLARSYVGEHPLRAGHLLEFGRELRRHLAQMPSAAGLPYLPDVAALEWAWHEVYHEADEAEKPPLAAAALAEMPAALQPQLRLHLQPATRFVASAYPVLRIWQAHQASEAAAQAPISLGEGGVRLLVARRDLEIEFRLLNVGEDQWLRTLAAGATLAAATQTALQTDPAFDLTVALTRHLSLATFAGLSMVPAAAKMPP